MSHYESIVGLVSDDVLWSKKATLVASTLKAATQARAAVETCLIDAFQQDKTITSAEFRTSTGRLCRVVLALGEEAAEEAEYFFLGEDTHE